jgi:MFS family permease
MTARVSPRLAVLAAYCVLAAVQGGTWAAFSSLPSISQDTFPHISTAWLAWLLNANNLGQAATTPIAVALLTRRGAAGGPTGMRHTVVAAAFCLLLQSGAWAISTWWPSAPWAVPLLLLGAIAGGASTAFTQGATTRLSAIWFAPDQRARATAAAYSSNYAGQSGAYIACLAICTSSQFVALLRAEGLLAAALLALLLLGFPDAPMSMQDAGPLQPLAAAPACGSAQTSTAADEVNAGESTLRRDLRRLRAAPDRRLVSSALLVGFTALLHGFYTAWAVRAARAELTCVTAPVTAYKNVLPPHSKLEPSGDAADNAAASRCVR